MPVVPKQGPALFLGLELATDQLRATIVDDGLELVGVESVDFDTELPEYQTQGGIFTTPGEAYTTPVEMWIKGLDILLEKLHRNYDLTRIKSIGGSAQHALVWWKSATIPSLSSLDPHLPFHSHFPSQSFSLPNTPIAQDTSSHAHALALEALLGGPDNMTAMVGTCATPSLIAAQLLRVRESWAQEVWIRTGRVQLASAFLASLVMGKWAAMSEAEACATGMWVHGAATQGSNGYWDEQVLDIVGGSREEGRRVRGWLGEVDTSGGGRRAGNVSRYLVERYGFDPDTSVTSFTSDFLASYLSLCPSPTDAVLAFGPMDMLLTPAQNYTPTRLYQLFPHPAQDPSEKRRYIAVLHSRNADVPRALVRDMYTKSWSAFDRLVAIVPPGGSIGLDDKLFSFWHLQGDTYPFSHVKGIFRFETGIKTTEFRDLRANPRCLIESQVLSFRVKWSRMIATGVLGTRKGAAGIGGGSKSGTPPPLLRTNTTQSLMNAGSTSTLPSSLGLPFDPYDHTVLPTRVLTTGAAANFPSVANLVGDIFNAPVYVPATQVDSAQIVPHRNAPAQGYPGRAALGAAYVARWVWGRDPNTSANSSGSSGTQSPSWAERKGLGGYEEEMRRLFGRRWVMSGGVWGKTSIGGTGVSGPVIGGQVQAQVGTGGGSVSGVSSGASTPFGTGSARSGLGSTVFAEEEEDEMEEMERTGGVGVIGGGMYSPIGAGGFGDLGRMRTQTSSTNDTLGSSTSSGPLPSTTYTTPDLNLGNLGMLSPNLGGLNGGPSHSLGSATLAPNSAATGGSSATPTTPTPLTPVVALHTGDLEAQIGLAKVAEPDLDAFMTYAAIVPEYCRLESMLIKNIV